SDTYRGEWAFEDLCSGREYRVDVNSILEGCTPGTIAVGRLLAYTSGRFLQSPGMAIMPRSEFGDVSARCRSFLDRAAAIPRTVAAEALIGEILGPPLDRPVAVPPASSPRQARRFLRALRWQVEDGAAPYGSGDLVMREWREALRRAKS